MILFFAAQRVQIPARSWQESGMSDDERPKRAKRRDRGPPLPPKPLDAVKLQALALHYAARYATTAAKLRTYLQRKLRDRPWEGTSPPDAATLVARLVDLGYVDDAAWAAAKRRTMNNRGLGPRRVTQALHAAGISAVDAEPEATDDDTPDSTIASALHFARRRRLGAFAREGAASDPANARRALAAMLRAGHDHGVARRVLAARTVAEAEALADEG
jgi:regulatory protein